VICPGFKTSVEPGMAQLLHARIGDPDLQFVALMCACCAEVFAGRIQRPYTNVLGEAWAERVISASDQHDARERRRCVRVCLGPVLRASA
jgi:hypothetical protein